MTAPLEVTLYGKPGCGLCDQAEAMLARISTRVPVRVTTVNIDSDADLQARYFLEIPVVAVAGEEIARAPLSERMLLEALLEISARTARFRP